MNLSLRQPRSAPHLGLAEDPAGPADETLADLVRTFGEEAVEIDGATEDFRRRCQAWARHLLVRGPAPVGKKIPEPAARRHSSASRAYADLREFFRRRRASERSFLWEATRDLKGTMVDMLTRMQDSARATGRDNVEMEGELSALERAALRGSLPELAAQVQRSLDVLGRQLDRRRAHHAQHIDDVGQRLEQLQADLSEAREQARLDPLTKLDNRASLDANLLRLVEGAQLSNAPLSVVMLDIDHFKRINDTYGHAAGDVVLRGVSGALVRSFVRRCDVIARYGGEEFCIVLPTTEIDDAERLTERLLDRLRERVFPLGGEDVTVTASAGVVQMAHSETHESLVERADRALYAAKREGRDRVVQG